MADLKIDRIIRSRRRTIALEVTRDARLVVRAPIHAAVEHIYHLVKKKQAWITKHLERMLANGGPLREKQFVDGEEFLILGQPHRLTVGQYRSMSFEDQLYFPEAWLPNARVHILAWYKQYAYEVVTARAQYFAGWTGWKYYKLSITNAASRWGSCGAGRSVNFSWRLVMAPLDIIDYVVVHELAHLSEKNHSERFWSKVIAILPDARQRQRWLRDHGHKFQI